LFETKAVTKNSLFGKTLVFHSNAVSFDTYWVIIRLYVYGMGNVYNSLLWLENFHGVNSHTIIILKYMEVQVETSVLLVVVWG
jgi:hypothetical protein